MKRSNRVVLLLGVVLALFAFVGVLAIGMPRVQVVVARGDLPLRTVQP